MKHVVTLSKQEMGYCLCKAFGLEGGMAIMLVNTKGEVCGARIEKIVESALAEKELTVLVKSDKELKKDEDSQRLYDKFKNDTKPMNLGGGEVLMPFDAEQSLKNAREEHGLPSHLDVDGNPIGESDRVKAGR